MLKEFSQKTRELFDQGGYMVSWESGRNDANCLHHILTRVSNSPYNACPLNNQREHAPEWRKGLPALSAYSVRRKYLLSTKRYLESIGYKPTTHDLKFIENNIKYYEQEPGKEDESNVCTGDWEFL